MTFPAYPKCKGSEASWLGALPSHWEVKRLKWLLEANDGGVWGGDADDDDATVVLRSTEQTVDGRWQIVDPALRKLTPEEKSSALLRRGDLLLTKSSGSSLHIGKTSLVDESVEALDACYSNFMQRLRASSCLLPKFAWYILNNEVARLQFDLLSKSTTGLANLNSSIIGELLVATAPIAEQRAIVAFLDRETGKIDALVAEQEKLIDLLKEKRQAVISHAVTKGLDPNAPMKDSGVEWLGEVPEHWQVVRLRFLGYVQSGVAKGRDLRDAKTISVPYLRVANVQAGYLALEDVAEILIAEDELKRYALQPGDVLMNEGGDFDKLGRGHVWGGEIMPCIHQNHVFSVRVSGVEPVWLSLLTSAAYGRFFFMSRSKQTTNLASISSNNIGEFPLTVPPPGERAEILEKVSREVAAIDSLMAEAARSIDLLKERRVALISAAVTGKIDVRGLVEETFPVSNAMEPV